MRLSIATLFLGLWLCAFGQPFYIDQLNSRNVLIGDDSLMPVTPLNGKLRFMEPLVNLSTNGHLLSLEGDLPFTWMVVQAANTKVDIFGNITANIFFGDGSGLTNLSGTVGLSITQHITDFMLGAITNVYSNGLLLATGAYVVPPAAGMQGAGGDNMLGAYGESLEPAG